MELGEKLKQARLEAGLSQRQLCGDTITRNMLSQIENGTANPSLETLRVLCARLGKPVTYFREDAPSENEVLIKQAELLPPREALEKLNGYLSPDPVLDSRYHSLYARCCLDLAEQALREKRVEYARTLIQKALEHPQPELARDGAVLSYRAGLFDAVTLAASLPDNTQEMILRAAAALQAGNIEKSLACLLAADRQTEEVLRLRGDALLQKQAYAEAADCFLALEQTPAVYSRLELCYRELGDYQKAYEYACKQR